MNKRGDFSILLLVVLVVILFGSTLFVFNTNQKKVNVELNDARFLNNVYLKENLIDFYVNEAIDMTIEDKFSGLQSFVTIFRNNLNKFVKEDISVSVNLKQIVDEFDARNIVIEDKVVIVIETQIVDKTGKIITTYNYDKQFVR